MVHNYRTLFIHLEYNIHYHYCIETLDYLRCKLKYKCKLTTLLTIFHLTVTADYCVHNLVIFFILFFLHLHEAQAYNMAP